MSSSKQPRRIARQLDAGLPDGIEACATHISQPQADAPPETRITKLSLVLDLLQREGGASLAEIIEVTGWLPHTARAALTGLRKKGHAIARTSIDGETRYTIAPAAVE